MNVTSVLKRTSFTMSFILIGLCYIFINVFVLLKEQRGKTGAERSQFVLYRACIDPSSSFSIPVVHVAPLSQLLLYVVDLIIILGNLFLSRFLERQTSNNKGIPKNNRYKTSLFLSQP